MKKEDINWRRTPVILKINSCFQFLLSQEPCNTGSHTFLKILDLNTFHPVPIKRI